METWRPPSDARTDAQILAALLRHDPSTSIPNLAEVVLNSVSEWTLLFRTYFEDPSRASIPPTVLLRNQLTPLTSSSSSCTAAWDEKCPWRSIPWIVPALLRLFLALPKNSIFKFEVASRLVPFIIHVADDYTREHRLSGVYLIEASLNAITDKVILQMQLDDLFFAVWNYHRHECHFVDTREKSLFRLHGIERSVFGMSHRAAGTNRRIKNGENDESHG